jgi:hypothetical protein
MIINLIIFLFVAMLIFDATLLQTIGAFIVLCIAGEMVSKRVEHD